MSEEAPSTRKVRALTNSSMSIQPSPGADISRVSEDAQRIADLLGITVDFSFNGIKCRAVPGRSAAHLAMTSEQEVTQAQAQRRKALIERIGTFADLCCQEPIEGNNGDVAYDLLRQAAAQLSSDALTIAHRGNVAAWQVEAIRARPYPTDDDYIEVRRDERERIIAALTSPAIEMEALWKEFLDADAHLTQCRNAMDSSSFNGRSKTAEARSRMQYASQAIARAKQARREQP